jgi:hypothetical protein
MSVRVKLDSCTEKLKLQLYSRNSHSYTFIFSLTNDKDKNKVKHHYFVIRRGIKEVEELGQNNNDAIITMEKEIAVFMKNEYKSFNEKENLAAYIKKMSFKDLIEEQKNQ